MPIFEYQCPKCHHRMEVLERTSKPTRHNCPHCKDTVMEKQFSTFACGSGQPEPEPPSCSGGSCATGQCPFS